MRMVLETMEKKRLLEFDSSSISTLEHYSDCFKKTELIALCSWLEAKVILIGSQPKILKNIQATKELEIQRSDMPSPTPKLMRSDSWHCQANHGPCPLPRMFRTIVVRLDYTSYAVDVLSHLRHPVAFLVSAFEVSNIP